MSIQMHEFDPTHVEKIPPIEAITDVMETWFTAEAESSRVGNNAVLDNFYAHRKSMLLPWDHPANQNAGKHKSHYNRLIEWTSQFVEIAEEGDERHLDYAIARQLFTMQMYASGMQRFILRSKASNQEEYETLRFDREPISVNAAHHIRTRVIARLGGEPTVPQELDGAGIDFRDLVSETLTVNDLLADTLAALHNRNRKPGSVFDIVRLSNARDLWVGAATDLQAACLDTSVDYILYAVQVRGGDLSKVPMLLAKSITSPDQEVRYPFAGQPLT